MALSVMSLYVSPQMVTTLLANEHSLNLCIPRDYTYEQVLLQAKHIEGCVKVNDLTKEQNTYRSYSNLRCLIKTTKGWQIHLTSFGLT